MYTYMLLYIKKWWNSRNYLSFNSEDASIFVFCLLSVCGRGVSRVPRPSFTSSSGSRLSVVAPVTFVIQMSIMYNNTRTICILCISYVNSCSLLERGSIPDGSSPSIVKGVTKISASRRVPFFVPLAARRSPRWNRTQEETVPSLRDRSNGGKRSRKRRAAGENRRSGKKITKTPRVVCLCFSKYFYSPYTRTISKRKRKKKRRYPFSCFLAVVSLADASQSIR